MPQFFNELTDADGYFEITGLPAGSYYISATPSELSGEFSYQTTIYYPLTTKQEEAERIILQEGETVEQKNFYLDRIRMQTIHLPFIQD